MLNCKELEVLKNAPSDATHYSPENNSEYSAYYKDDFKQVLCYDSLSRWEESKQPAPISFICIADLRKQKEQDGKTMKIVAAVNYFRGDVNFFIEHEGERVSSGSVYMASQCGYFLSDHKEAGYNLVCTIGEFNQHAKEMSDTAGHNKLVEYSSSEKHVVTADSVKSDVVEWSNGDECVWSFMEAVFIGDIDLGNNLNDCVIHINSQNRTQHAYKSQLSKPETPAQKAAKERYAKIQKLVNLYCLHNTGKFLEAHDVMNVVSVLVDNGVIVK